jgi:hypothetical protein
MTCFRAGHFRLSNIVFQEQGLGQNLCSNSHFEEYMRFCWLGLPNPKPFLLDSLAPPARAGVAIQQSYIENCWNLCLYAKSSRIE